MEPKIVLLPVLINRFSIEVLGEHFSLTRKLNEPTVISRIVHESGDMKIINDHNSHLDIPAILQITNYKYADNDLMILTANNNSYNTYIKFNDQSDNLLFTFCKDRVYEYADRYNSGLRDMVDYVFGGEKLYGNFII